jgi:hypothetical protein
MLAGELFRLNRDTLAVVVVDGRPRPVIVPAGIVIKVVSDLKLGNKKVDVLWSGRTVEMFALDVRDRGSVVANRSAGTERLEKGGEPTVSGVRTTPNRGASLA